jgi:hypothetical protein
MRFGTLISIILGIAGTFVIAAAQTSVTEAKSNLSGWLNELGLTELPAFLTSIDADNWGTAFGIFLIVAAISLYLFRRSRRLKQPGTPFPSKVAESDVRPLIETPLVPKGITISGIRHANGVDVEIILHIRNRSRFDIRIGQFEWHYAIAENSPLNKTGLSFHEVMPSGSEQMVSLPSVRIYSHISPDDTGWLKANITFETVDDGMTHWEQIMYQFTLLQLSKEDGAFRISNYPAVPSVHYEIRPAQPLKV